MPIFNPRPKPDVNSPSLFAFPPVAKTVPARADNPSAAAMNVPDPSFEEVESLIADTRADLTPAQMVERKLSLLLKGRPVLVSHVRLSQLPGNRRR